MPEVPVVAQVLQWVLSPGDVGASKEGGERAALATAPPSRLHPLSCHTLFVSEFLTLETCIKFFPALRELKKEFRCCR